MLPKEAVISSTDAYAGGALTGATIARSYHSVGAAVEIKELQWLAMFARDGWNLEIDNAAKKVTISFAGVCLKTLTISDAVKTGAVSAARFIGTTEMAAGLPMPLDSEAEKKAFLAGLETGISTVDLPKRRFLMKLWEL